jgi:hypothetical protein
MAPIRFGDNRRDQRKTLPRRTATKNRHEQSKGLIVLFFVIFVSSSQLLYFGTEAERTGASPQVNPLVPSIRTLFATFQLGDQRAQGRLRFVGEPSVHKIINREFARIGERVGEVKARDPACVAHRLARKFEQIG